VASGSLFLAKHEFVRVVLFHIRRVVRASRLRTWSSGQTRRRYVLGLVLDGSPCGTKHQSYWNELRRARHAPESLPEALTTGTTEPGTNAVAVFPNPTTDRITIKTNSSVGALFMITDQAGRQVASGKLAQECTTVDLSGSAAGAYSLRIGDHVSRTLKVIKQ
jgi:hypothetical protein